ncbi:DUF6192 family protein [Streptomyces werraensis]|uniref:DUF6192 family protein n=1 Tax=Streptomyces werraensis TaxID=68284 RepID=UPI00307F893A
MTPGAGPASRWGPISPQEKVTAIHALAQDDKVAAAVTGDLLRRPQVAVNVAQTTRSGWWRSHPRRGSRGQCGNESAAAAGGRVQGD